VAERLKAPDSKSGVRETVPWVQIPPLPMGLPVANYDFSSSLRFIPRPVHHSVLFVGRVKAWRMIATNVTP
jgi:hypothetical protein